MRARKALAVPQRFFRLLNRIERAAAYAQGKGYGSAAISQEVMVLLRLLGRRPKLAIDIGGNVGDYTAELRTTDADLEIHTFEPSASNIEKLNRRFQADRHVTIVPMGVSDSDGSVSLFSNEPGSNLGSLTQRNLEHSGLRFDTTETVNVIRFENYWRSKLQERPLDIVKIDIEGHELTALDGFGAALDATHVLQFEFGGCNIDTRNYFRDFWHLFTERGFALYRITPLGAEQISRYSESDEYFLTTNYVAVRRR